MSTFVAVGRHLGAASLAGLIAGVLVAGVLGRIVMRVSGATSRPELIGSLTSNGNRVGEITLAGTVALALFVGVSAGLAGGVLFASAEPWLRSRRWRGVLFGLGILVALGFSVLDPANIDFKRFGNAPLNVVLFTLLFIAFGATVAWLFDRLRAAISGRGPMARALEIVAWLAAFGAIALLVVGVGSFGGLADPLPAIVVAIAVFVPPIVRWRGLPRSVAYSAFAVPVVAGGARTVAGLVELLG